MAEKHPLLLLEEGFAPQRFEALRGEMVASLRKLLARDAGSKIASTAIVGEVGVTQDILGDLNFGATIAEDEKSEIEDYFVETDVWGQLYRAKKDIVFGDKGSGKSALFVRLSRDRETLRDRKILFLSAEEIKGAPAFQGVEKVQVGLLKDIWKLHLLSIIIDELREKDFPKSAKLKDVVKKQERILVERSILRPLGGRRIRLAEIVQNVVEYVKLAHKAPGVGDTSLEIKFRPLSSAEIDSGRMFIDDMLRELDEELGEWKIWAAVDRLDVAFRESPQTERAALRALFEVYRDLRGLENIRFLIFLRKDIWARISDGGFPEKTHVDSRSIDITWSEEALQELVARRALQSIRFRQAFRLDKDAAPAIVLKCLLPEKVEAGPRQSSAFRWVLSHTRDGNSIDSPREIISLLNQAIIQEQKSAKDQAKKPSAPIISAASLKSAWPAVSSERVNSNLLAEYPRQKKYIELLRGKKCEQNMKSLSSIWGVKPDEAAEVIEALQQAGFFSVSGDGKSRTYKIPFVFRPELGLVQGRADGVG